MAQETPTPGFSTETFKTWRVQCSTVASSKPGEAKDGAESKDAAAPESKRVCEAVQIFSDKKNNNEIARIAFAYTKTKDAKEETLTAWLRVPVNVSFEKQPKILNGEETLLEGKFANCAGKYCYGEFVIGKDGTAPLEKAENPILQFPIASGSQIQFKASSAGLSDALAVLKSRSK
jgi:invasion protein IalB